MSDSNNKDASSSFWKGLGELFSISVFGLRQIDYKNSENILAAVTAATLLFTICLKDKYIRLASNFGVYDSQSWLWRILGSINWLILFFILALLLSLVVGFMIGIVPFVKRRRLQNKLDTIGLSNAQNQKPFVIREIDLDEIKSRLLISANGIGVDKFQNRKSDIESAFQKIVETITVSSDRKSIEVLMCKHELRKLVPYVETEQFIKESYQFAIGDSANGIITANLRELPHLLIAGSTGGGKSVFFRSVFTSLIKHSANLQVYLIDLKNGVEVKEFSTLPNVRVAKNEDEAVKLLRCVHKEMKRRFLFMEEKGIKKIEPHLHKLDLIVVGIDEASVLFGKTKINKQKENLVSQAREITDELAKLSRAAGIHLIVATQKPVKDSIDTKVMENLTGRMVFKMSTHAGSNAALGNAKAFNLPDTKGRAIWSGGNKFIEVQAPFIAEEEFESECVELLEISNSKEKELFGKMLDPSETVDSGTAVFSQSIDEVTEKQEEK